MFSESKLIHKITGIGVCIALTIVLSVVSNYIQIGSISINLSLIPIALAGILFGPLAGLLVGVINGAFVLLAPSTGAFFAINLGGTIVTCLTKTGLAGLVSGLLFLPFKKYPKVGSIVSSLSVPVINTGLFMLFSLIFFGEIMGTIISIFVLINFAIELAVTIVLSSFLYHVVVLFKNKKKASGD